MSHKHSLSVRETANAPGPVKQPSGLSRDEGTCLAGWPCQLQGLWQEATVSWLPASPRGSLLQQPANLPPLDVLSGSREQPGPTLCSGVSAGAAGDPGAQSSSSESEPRAGPPPAGTSCPAASAWGEPGVRLSSFLTELTRLFQKCRTSGSVFITLKKYDGRTKPVPRKGHVESFEPADNKCLLRATDGKKKISTVVSSKEVNKFQMAYSNLLRANMDGLKKKDKKSKAKKSKATQ
ncbi:signal recognition particle 14 kDa protein [Geospiza fortis]|uniref:Signal recognition particle 14 kDa protein n=2 Tax=Passeriformes TaxID=9126 RepID=A0A8N5I3W4_GEOFO|nr:signal recognition particle 14 kDa protein [Geospiza fortis]